MDQILSTGQNSATGVKSYMIGGTRFDIPQEYTPIQYVNKGANGVVCSGYHNPTGTKVAIKKVSGIFGDLENTKRLLREVKLLRHFCNEHVLSIADIFKPPSKAEFEDLYIVSDLMDTDLEVIINSGQPLSETHIQYFTYQLLCAVKYIHSANVLHRDIKPANILCNEDCTIKLADFGLARVQNKLDDLTEYVATRWYRAPEVILSWKEYTKQIDIWSVGCILAELYLRKPLFQGQDYIHQITRITDILGSPQPEDINMLVSERAREFLIQMGPKPKIPWNAIIPNISPLCADLLDNMLAFNPSKRYTVDQALNHPYFEDIRDPDIEVNADAIFSFDFEKWKLSKEIYQELFYNEICYFHPEAALQIEKVPTPMSPAQDTHLDDSSVWSPSPVPLTPNSAFLHTCNIGNETPDYESIFGSNHMMD